MTLISPQSLTLDRRQLCELLDLSDSGFSRAQARLEAANFPKKLPGMHKWSRPAVVAWIKANGDLSVMLQILVGSTGEPEDEQLDALEAPESISQRYGGNAA